MRTYGLPIDDALPSLRAALASRRAAVLQAPPGAGKSTVVPLALLDEPWVAGGRLLMLEPRRLATRAVAQRMAATLGERVGDTVGYRMRLDTRVSRATRIEVVTEGVLTRMLQSDPALEGVAAVIFDEFHERSLQADLGLALALDAQENLSPDLRLLVMSATLDGEAVAKLLGDAPIVSAPGRAYPVQTRYAGRGAPALPGEGPPGTPWDAPERAVAQIVREAIESERGDVLVFLPGAPEIRRVQSRLSQAAPGPAVRVIPLYGELDAADQDAALAPSPPGTRKVVLATNIAETSLTIDGVRVVVDSGLVRRSRFDPATGMSRLETMRISRASADQRQGRAGRTQPGVCYRAWSEGAQRSLAPFTPPEIAEADLVPLALDLANWGIADATALRWLDVPPAAQLASARDVLRALGALDAAGRITPHGRAMAGLGVHPRIAHMLLRAQALGAAGLAADLAALLSERDLLRAGRGERDADIRTRLELLSSGYRDDRVDPGTLQRVRRLARELERQVARGGPPRDAAGASEGVLLAFAYPDRIGRRRAGGDGRYTLANGRGAHFDAGEALAKHEFIVALDLDDRDRDARIRLAAPLAREDLDRHFADALVRAAAVEWDSRAQAVLARRTVKLGELVIEDKPLPDMPADAARAAMLQGVRELGLGALPWSREARDVQARMEFVRALGRPDLADWPAVDEASLAATLDDWLPAWLDGVTRREHLSRIPLEEALRGRLPWAMQQRLDELAPTHLTVPTGSRRRSADHAQLAPVASMRLQEVFGLESTPRIGGGKVPVVFKLLSPAHRPVQVTRDLASFWRGAYAEVRKDLRGRYPRHYWPENPLEAEPTRGVRRPR